MEQIQPLVIYPTASSSESVLTVLQMYNTGVYTIPDYQRDSDQWDIAKKSLFAESILNNLTIPGFFLAPIENGKYEVVDGQQRLITLREYYANKLRLVGSDEADYLGDRSAYYAGKTFEEVKKEYPRYAQTFENFLLTLIKLPQGIEDSTRREIFRRINQAGTPLSAQDIRLAYYGSCRPVTFIRLAGISSPEREGAKRMVQSAQTKYTGLQWPWGNTDQTTQEDWKNWWDDKQTGIGQTASEMFLWFLIAKHLKQLDDLLSNSNHLATALKITFDGRTEEAADIFCAQMLYESRNEQAPKILCASDDLESVLFPIFAKWWHELHVLMPNVGVDRNRRIALLVGALSSLGDPQVFTEHQWGLVESFIRAPRQTAADMGIDYPEARGKWRGSRGQKSQIQTLYELAKRISSESSA